MWLLEWILIAEEQGYGHVYIAIYKDLPARVIKVLRFANFSHTSLYIENCLEDISTKRVL